MSYDFHTSRLVRSRKEHVCDGDCRKVMAPGQPHQYLAGKYDGEFDTARVCEGCDELHRAILDHFGVYGEDGPGLGGCAEYLHDEGVTESPAEWLAAYRERKAVQRQEREERQRQADDDLARTLGLTP